MIGIACTSALKELYAATWNWKVLLHGRMNGRVMMEDVVNNVQPQCLKFIREMWRREQ